MDTKMKKFLIIFVITLLFCGCDSDPYTDYKHCKLEDKDAITYTIHYDDGDANYAVADVSKLYGVSEIELYGLLYKVAENDYIVLDTFGLRNTINYSAKFYNDKLYVLTNGQNAGNYVYTLDREKFKKKKFSYNFEGNFELTTIKNIEDNMIYFAGTDHNSSSFAEGHREYKCSLNGNDCEIIESGY